MQQSWGEDRLPILLAGTERRKKEDATAQAVRAEVEAWGKNVRENWE